jgi:predicted DNA-binding transcriptional regulator AlpA
MPDDLPPRMLSRGDVADLFGVTRETVKRWEQAGKLPSPVRVGRHSFWRPTAILAVLDGKGEQGDA